MLYQLIINHFHVNYFANDGNIRTAKEPVPYKSNYGKTKEPFEPTEASKILFNWFGKSKRVLPEMESVVSNVVNAAEPLVMKNIWNVWRVDEWERLVGACKWIWIRRDTTAAAYSDYLSHNRNGGLNGAYLEFVGVTFLPPLEMAVKQQKDIEAAIRENLDGKDYIEVWYKDIVQETRWQLLRLEMFLGVERRSGIEIPRLENHND